MRDRKQQYLDCLPLHPLERIKLAPDPRYKHPVMGELGVAAEGSSGARNLFYQKPHR